ncbi:hypothetical protein DFH11DRAFT_1505670 [Phellopilus nigrolimitatus]|nr:hypothetical protein DFH11DRAFT_1505670 [Phellopilus nigrolimitatus]
MNEFEKPNVDKARNVIHLRGLPLSATPADVLRLTRQAGKGGLSKIADVKLDYRRFIPTGAAFITMTDANYVEDAVKTLRDTQMATLPLRAYRAPEQHAHPRLRGVSGRAEAAERAVLDGNGGGGGVNPKACDVVLYGLPGMITPLALRRHLRKLGLVEVAPNGEPMCDVVKIEPPKKTFTSVSKHLVRLKSPAEAHTLVRRLHMTYFIPEIWQTKYLMRARVVY